MQLMETLLVAASLAVDSCVISLARGLATPHPRGSDALAAGGVMGAFHGAAAPLGALLGTSTSALFERVDHWVAFTVLAALGLKSLLESRGLVRRPPKSATPSTLGLLLAPPLVPPLSAALAAAAFAALLASFAIDAARLLRPPP